jgi:hypothetical protein
MGELAAPLEIDPFEWWATHAHHYPRLAKVAAAVLSAPPGSVASEQLFSSVSDVYARPKRNRLTLSNTQKFIFLNKCLPMIDFKYDLVDVRTQESSTESDSDDSEDE